MQPQSKFSKWMVRGLPLSLLLSTSLLIADDCPAILDKPIQTKKFGEVRSKTIKGWDKLLTWAFLPANRPYILVRPFVEEIYRRSGESLPNFVRNYGFFSVHHPILGIVTDAEKDVAVVQCLLNSVQEEIADPGQLRFARDEILSKVLAYRTLKKGMQISIPISKEQTVVYTVDKVIDMWRGMPAYGLVPEKTDVAAPPLLLFRGTDLNLGTERSWASVLSDLDVAGPGQNTFFRARQEIHDWLAKMKQSIGAARIVGYSLGGVFTLYTLVYEADLVNKTVDSIAFNPPGVSDEVLALWDKMAPENRPPHVTYVNQGDFVSQIGLFLGNVHEISLNEPMEVIAAHVTLISGEPLYKIATVDVSLENEARK